MIGDDTMRTIEQMIQSEVLVCLSSLVSTLAAGHGAVVNNGRPEYRAHVAPLIDLTEQAFELACPVPDYEEAAIQESWTGPYKDQYGATYFQCGADAATWSARDWEALCRDHEIEPYDREVFEHWAVTDWFADKLIAAGEKVDKDFAGMCVWARTTTGQGIAQDYVIQCIHKSLQT
jgi:hypothetical protein